MIIKFGSISLSSIALLNVCGLFLLLSGCSLNRSSESSRVTIEFPELKEKAMREASRSIDFPSQLAAVSSSPSPAPSSTFSPRSIDDLNCFAINVIGQGINPDSFFSSNGGGSCSGNPYALPMGIVGGLYPLKGGTAQIDIPSGSGRILQIIGIATADGTCPDLKTAIQNSPNGFGLTPPMEIGRTTFDFFADSTVSVKIAFDPANPKVVDCKSSGSGGSSSSGGNSPSQAPLKGLMLRGYDTDVGSCTSVNVEGFSDSGNYQFSPLDSFNVKLVSDNGGAFYSDSSCTVPLSTAVISGLNSYNQSLFYKRPTGGVDFIGVQTPDRPALQNRKSILLVGDVVQWESTAAENPGIDGALKLQSMAQAAFVNLSVNPSFYDGQCSQMRVIVPFQFNGTSNYSQGVKGNTAIDLSSSDGTFFRTFTGCKNNSNPITRTYIPAGMSSSYDLFFRAKEGYTSATVGLIEATRRLGQSTYSALVKYPRPIIANTGLSIGVGQCMPLDIRFRDESGFEIWNILNNSRYWNLTTSASGSGGTFYGSQADCGGGINPITTTKSIQRLSTSDRIHFKPNGSIMGSLGIFIGDTGDSTNTATLPISVIP